MRCSPAYLDFRLDFLIIITKNLTVNRKVFGDVLPVCVEPQVCYHSDMQTYFTILASLLILDGVWLMLVATEFYKKYLGYIFAETFKFLPIGLFYIIYAFGIMYFVVNPALEAKSLTLALGRGAFLGLLAYGAYDFTNHATIAKWPIQITIVDLLWGICLTALASGIAYLLVSKM